MRRAFSQVRAAMQTRWHAGAGSVIALLFLVALLELWASGAQDPDFWLPDPFHPLVAGLVFVFALSGFVPHAPARRALQLLLFAIPVLVLVAETHLAASDADIGSTRLVVSDDLLLRYTYRPGLQVRDRGGEMTITADGLWDQLHVIPRPPGVTRVVILGDSVPNDPSLAFSERFPHVLEGLLAKRAPAGTRVEVINVPCEGYNTRQEVRLLERVGLAYEPDLIIVAYVLNDPFLQNGAYRRLGNSFFAFKVAAALELARKGGMCPLFAKLARGYQFELSVRDSLERLRLVTRPLRLPVLVATVPIVERFEDPVCLGLYDQVVGVAREQGFASVRLVDGFLGQDPERFLKPSDRSDITHPNQAGHALVAAGLEAAAAKLLWPAAP